MAEKECRRCSISGLLMLIWRSLMGHFVGASCGYRKTFRGPRSGSRSLQIRPKSVRPYIRPTDFFFRADFGARKWNSGRRNEKKDVQKSELVTVCVYTHLQLAYTSSVRRSMYSFCVTSITLSTQYHLFWTSFFSFLRLEFHFLDPKSAPEKKRRGRMAGRTDGLLEPLRGPLKGFL